MNQSGINCENPPRRTIDFIGSREISIQTHNGEKKRSALFSLINATGTLFLQLAVLNGTTPESREVRDYDDENTLHSCQENAWCSQQILEGWHARIWRPIDEVYLRS